ncbi:MAG TPA: hypothetical protein VMU14_04210 [Acidimicrobiales bacterium]|nr:hypothetical protein [Acidimicrobiales bacterium]
MPDGAGDGAVDVVGAVGTVGVVEAVVAVGARVVGVAGVVVVSTVVDGELPEGVRWLPPPCNAAASPSATTARPATIATTAERGNPGRLAEGGPAGVAGGPPGGPDSGAAGGWGTTRSVHRVPSHQRTFLAGSGYQPSTGTPSR